MNRSIKGQIARCRMKWREAQERRERLFRKGNSRRYYHWRNEENRWLMKGWMLDVKEQHLYRKYFTHAVSSVIPESGPPGDGGGVS